MTTPISISFLYPCVCRALLNAFFESFGPRRFVLLDFSLPVNEKCDNTGLLGIDLLVHISVFVLPVLPL